MRPLSFSLLLGSVVLSLLNAVVNAAVPALPKYMRVEERQTNSGRLVFCHFMIGIMSDRHSVSDYDIDMQLAKQYGIDAFALNIGVDPYTDAQLELAYQSAANNGMQVFISFDFNWYNTGQSDDIGRKVATYGVRPAQLKIDGKVFVSSFAGDGLDVRAMKAAAARYGNGMDVMFVPNFHPGQGDFSVIDGALNWMAWPNNGRNKAPDGWGNVSVEAGDQSYINALGGKPYLAPASAWFSTHFGPEVPYSKNWVFPGDRLWYNRWEELLTLGARWIEIVTWNDYGESHYVGPLSSKHQDDGASKWINDLPHFPWIEMAKPYIAAFKDGATSVTNYITEDKLVYWYRINKRSLDCDSTDTTMVSAHNESGNYFQGRPYGWETLVDEVFVVALLTQPGVVTLNSGANTRSYAAPKGSTIYSIPMDLGRQSFALSRNGANVLAGVSLHDITGVCNCGIYNFNPYVGALPPSFSDPAGPDALNSLVQGLHVQTCAPTPSLPSSAPPYTGPGGQPPVTTEPPPGTTPPPVTTPPATTPPTTTPPATSPPVTSPPTSPPSTTPPTTTTRPPATCTITASSQIFPTNCLPRGCVWQGPPGQGTPDHCDGGRRAVAVTAAPVLRGRAARYH